MYNLARTEDCRVYSSLDQKPHPDKKEEQEMTAPKYPGDEHPALDSEVDFAGYDPYIVALTGGGPAGTSSARAIASRQASKGKASEGQAPESRKVKLMTWLREHRA